MPTNYLYAKPGSAYASGILREYEEWGLKSVDVVHPPRRFWSDQESLNAVVEEGIDLRRLQPLPSPAQLLHHLPESDNWQPHSRRSLARLHAHYLICEDPQRRMDVREVETLSHQVSLVQHILQRDGLKRILIADEVGLGKTVEAGLLLKELLVQRPGLRVLYLAPARLVGNVRREFDRMKLPFRQWTSQDGDARLTDPRLIASIHRAVHGDNFDKILAAQPWDVLIVDECHHLTAWSADGGDPTEAYRLVRELIAKQPRDARVILMSGTPHQGHTTRFENLLRFLREPREEDGQIAGRVIYRTKDDIEDWDGNPVFPPRQVNEPLVIDLGPRHREWIRNIHNYYRPPYDSYIFGDARRRAAGWRCAQAMQWAASSPLAGLGYLVRQAVRSNWDLSNQTLKLALATLRPYRLGPADEPIERLFQRIEKEVDRQQNAADIEDIEDIEKFDEDQVKDWLSDRGLEVLLLEGVELVKNAGDEKWEIISERLLHAIGDEKVVLFAQPIETVTSLVGYLARTTGRKPALVIGGQTDAERKREVDAFWDTDGPNYLISSRAGGEGLNMQVARRLIHIDVPWNPMDMEQRVGRIHRFGSRETVIIDTVVVKDSREADAYRIARDKLRVIAITMVEKDKFESVFSRVMCLLPQDALQNLLLNSPAAPLNTQDEEKLSEMIQQGYQDWKTFHDRFGAEKGELERQNPGLLTWDDIVFFLEEMGGARRENGHQRQRFQREGKIVNRIDEDATVVQLSDGKRYVCGDYGEALVFGPDKVITPKLGLNLKPVAEIIRKFAFPEGASGAAYLRWPTAEPMPSGLPLPLGALVFLRQTLRADKAGGWLVQGNALRCFVIYGDKSEELEDERKRRFLQGLFRSVIRKASEPIEDLLQAISAAEVKLIEELRRPSEEEMSAQIRHAVTPLFAGVITT
jgi:superfamily II DNA or RNA helicase